jgi:hypothetical protein
MTAQTDGSQVCQGDPELFFSEVSADNVAAAKACSHCPFQLPCRLEGLVNDEEGVWGGWSYNRRRRMGQAGRQRAIEELRFLLAQERTGLAS